MLVCHALLPLLMNYVRIDPVIRSTLRLEQKDQAFSQNIILITLVYIKITDLVGYMLYKILSILEAFLIATNLCPLELFQCECPLECTQ